MALSIDIGAALRAARTLEGVAGGAERVKKRAVATLQRRLQAEAARAIPGRFNVPASLVRNRLSVKDAGDAVELIGSGRPLPLHHFGGQYGGRLSPGASAQILVGGERRTRSGSFVRVKDRDGKIMVRADSKREPGRRVQRLPIKTLYGPDVGSMLLSDNVGNELLGFGRRILEAEVARLIAVELRGL